MDEKAIEIVKKYILEHLGKSDETPNFSVYTVWKVKALQNWKYLINNGFYKYCPYCGAKMDE